MEIKSIKSLTANVFEWQGKDGEIILGCEKGIETITIKGKKYKILSWFTDDKPTMVERVD